MNEFKLVALLPMKAHSERVKNKNFRPFLDRPLFQWTLDHLLKVDRIEKVIINTDSEAMLAREYKILEDPRVLVRERPMEIRGDFVSMNWVIEDDLGAVKADQYLMTHTTNPLISAETFQKALETFDEVKNAGYDSLFSVNKFQSRFYDADLKPLNHDPNNLIRTQDLPVLYEENSCFYLFTQVSFGQTQARIGNKPYLFKTPLLESVDIDDQTTWNLAEHLAANTLLK